jgi:SAM-dependent methyltransferase
MSAMPSSGVRRLWRRTRARLQLIKRITQGGIFPRECPICGFVGPFDYFGDPPRRDAGCPRCSSLERHRLMKLWCDRSGDLIRGGRAIHFAPEPAVVGFLAKLASEYITADIAAGRANVVRNIEAMEDPDESFDWIVCSHVLEHVDDRKALTELKRILRPNGVAILMVPIVEGWDSTYENPSVTSPRDRDLHFGQNDHVRFYGRDFRDRIRAVGFDLTEFTATEPDVARYGLLRGEKIFLARRP